MIKGTTPAVVTVWTGCMMIGVCFLLGEVVLLCNLWCQKGLGTAIAVGLVIVHSVIRMFSYFRYYHVWTWFSPVSWMDYSLMGHTNQKYAVLRLWDRYGPGFEHPTGDAEYCYSPSM